MIYPHCEFEIGDNVEICPYCQTFVNQSVDAKTQPFSEESNNASTDEGEISETGDNTHYVKMSMTKKEFMRLYPMRRWKEMIVALACSSYVAAIFVFFAGAFAGPWYEPSDGIDTSYLLCALGLNVLAIIVQVKKDIVSVFFLDLIMIWGIYLLFFQDGLSGLLEAPEMLFFLIGYIVIIYLMSKAAFSLDSAWEDYKAKGILPGKE